MQCLSRERGAAAAQRVDGGGGRHRATPHSMEGSCECLDLAIDNL